MLRTTVAEEFDIIDIEPDYFDIIDIAPDYKDYTEKSSNRGIRRKKDVAKALNKRRKNMFTNSTPWYRNLHQYSKNKIHCSCGMCRFRSTWNPDAKPIQDLRNEESMTFKEKEYELGEAV